MLSQQGPSHNPLTRLAYWLGAQPWVMRRSTQIIWLDRWVHRISRGRMGLLAIACVPSLTLISTGRNSGQLRQTHLLCQPRGEKLSDGYAEYAIVGSNWGRHNHPAWSYNLDANPDGQIVVRGKTFWVSARRVDGAEYQRVWA